MHPGDPDGKRTGRKDAFLEKQETVTVDGAFLTGFMLFAALFFVGLNGVFVLAKFAFATIRDAQVERVLNEGRV